MVKLSICKYDNKQCDVKEQYWHWIRDGIQPPPLFLDPPTLIQQESCHLTQWSREINVISPPAHPKNITNQKKYLDKKAWNVISHHSLFTAVFSSKLYKLDRLDRDYSVRLINRNWIQLSSENSILQQNFNSFHISLFSTTSSLLLVFVLFRSRWGYEGSRSTRYMSTYLVMLMLTLRIVRLIVIIAIDHCTLSPCLILPSFCPINGYWV